MRAILDLWQLARIADQNDIVGAGRHRQHVGQSDLSRFVHEDVVEMPAQPWPGEQPVRPADDIGTSEEILIVLPMSSE